MKWILFSLFIFCAATSALCQTQKDTSGYVTVSPGLKIKRNEQIKAYADSINNYVIGTKPPNFLFDECFEIDNALWKSFHPSTSVRWEILQQVKNKSALKAIMGSHRKMLDQKCSSERIHDYKITIPTADQSFYQLMRRRYRQL